MADVPAVNREAYNVLLDDGEILGQIGPRDLRRFRNTAKYIAKGIESMLDVGCFSGHWLDFVLQNRPEIRRHLGVDVSEAKVEDAKRRFPGLHVEVACAEDLSLKADRYDLVTCLEVLEHIPGWLAVFHSLFRLATKQVLVTVPYRQEITYTSCVHCGKLTPLYGHLRTYTEESFPEVSGWRRSFVLMRDWGLDRRLAVRLYRLVRPRYPWLLADYRRNAEAPGIPSFRP